MNSSGHIAKISGLLFRAESPSKLILLGTAGQAELIFTGAEWLLSTRSLQYGPLEFPFPSRAEAVGAILAAMEYAQEQL